MTPVATRTKPIEHEGDERPPSAASTRRFAMRGAARCERVDCGELHLRDAVSARRVSVVPSARPRHVHTGCFGGQMHAALQSRNACFTIRSSPEWYAMTASVPPGVEPVAQRGQRALEPRKLVVHGDADGLKESSKFRRARSRSEHGANRADEIVARRERLSLSRRRTISRARRAPRGSSPKSLNIRVNVASLSLFRSVAPRRRRRRRPFAYPDGAPGRNVKPRSSIVHLMRGYAEVEKNAVEARALSSTAALSISAKFDSTAENRPATAYPCSLVAAAASASGSRSTPTTVCTPASSSASEWPPPPRVQSRTSLRVAEELGDLTGEHRRVICASRRSCLPSTSR